MGKIRPVNLTDIKYTPKELSDHWRRYFSTLSIDLNKLFMKYTYSQVSVRFLHREVFIFSEYLKHTSQNSVMLPFKINPAHEMGFIYIPGEFSEFLINALLGGKDGVPDNVHYLTSFDEKIISNAMSDMAWLVEKHLVQTQKELKLELEPVLNINDLKSTLIVESTVSVQQFLIMTGESTYVFDLAFSNKFLESFVLL